MDHAVNVINKGENEGVPPKEKLETPTYLWVVTLTKDIDRNIRKK